MSTFSRRFAPLAAVCVVALSLVACAADNEGSGASSTTQVTETGESPAGGATIKIGLANNEGAAINIPQFRYGAEAAVRYINEGGGVHGRQLEIVECINDATPEGSVNCANRFVDEGAVAYFAGVDLGADAALPILTEAGIPFVSTEPWGQLSNADPNSWIMGPAQGTLVVASLQALKDEGATKVAAIFVDEPVSRELLTAVAEPVSEQIGLEVVSIFVDTANPDWATAMAAAIGQDVDAMWGILPEQGCTGAVRAARAAGFDGPFSLVSCSLYLSEAPEAAVNTLTVSSTWLPAQIDTAPVETAEQLEIYSDAMTASGYEDSINSFAGNSFATMMELASVIETIDGEVTGATLAEALGRATDMPGFMRERLQCRTDVWPSEPSACRAALLSLRVEADDDGSPIQVADSSEMIDLSSFAG